MRRDKERILRMLENGKISAEEAEKLLNAVSSERKGHRIVESIMGSFFGAGKKAGAINEEFEAENVDMNIKMANAVVEESPDSKFRISGEGILSRKKKSNVTAIDVTGNVKIQVPSDSSVNTVLKLSSMTGRLKSPLKLVSRMSNIELRALKPVDIEVECKMGNVVLYFNEPVNQHFRVNNNMGSIQNDFGLSGGEYELEGTVGEEKARVNINAKLSSVELKKYEEV